MPVEIRLSERELIRQRIKLCALVVERNLRFARLAHADGYHTEAQLFEDVAAVTAMFAVEMAEQHREVLAS